MLGHYVRVQEAAALLGVATPTIRWYCSQGLLPTYWIGRGQMGHRRFLYSDVSDLAQQLGRTVVPEREWATSEEWGLKIISEYLGLSGKFLVDAGFIESTAKLTWDAVKRLEQEIYGQDGEIADGETHGGRHHTHEGRFPHQHRIAELGQGQHPRGNPIVLDPFGPPLRWNLHNVDRMDIIMLNSVKRHLEAHKMDLEEKISEINHRISALTSDPTGE